MKRTEERWLKNECEDENTPNTLPALIASFPGRLNAPTKPAEHKLIH